MPASSWAAPWRSIGRRRRMPSATAWASPWDSRRCAPPGASTTSSTRTSRAPSASTPASAASTTARAAWWRSAARARCTRSRIARKLKIPRVVFPVGAGVMSALGLLISPLAFEVARSRRIHVADIDAADFAATFRALESEAKSYLLSAGVAERDIRVEAAPRHALPGPGPRDRGDAAGCGRSRRAVRRSRGAVRARLRGGLHAAPRRAGGDRQLEGRGGGAGAEPRHRLRAVGTGRDRDRRARARAWPTTRAARG